LIRLTILKTRSKHNDHKLRVALVVTAADLHKVVMVVHLSKPMVSRRAGMDSLPLVKDNMDSRLRVRDNMGSLLRARDNMGSLLRARDNMGSLLRARDNMGSSQVPMVDHHQTNLLTVDSRAGILLRRLHGGTKMRLSSDACEVSRLIKDTTDGMKRRVTKRALLVRPFMQALLQDTPLPTLSAIVTCPLQVLSCILHDSSHTIAPNIRRTI
jgi:hypothetical protein